MHIRCPSVSIAPPTHSDHRRPVPSPPQPSRSNNTPHYTESDHGVLYLRRMWRVHEEGQSRCSCGEMSSVLLCELVRMRILHLGEAELMCIITHSSIHDISHCLLSYDSRSQCRVSFPFASSVLALRRNEAMRPDLTPTSTPTSVFIQLFTIVSWR